MTNPRRIDGGDDGGGGGDDDDDDDDDDQLRCLPGKAYDTVVTAAEFPSDSERAEESREMKL